MTATFAGKSTVPRFWKPELARALLDRTISGTARDEIEAAERVLPDQLAEHIEAALINNKLLLTITGYRN